MKLSEQNIAVILARRHSKGLSLKNLRQVGGLSLVGRAVSAAVESACFDRIIVSSDGADILEEAAKYGAETLMRPSELSDDHASSISGVIHVLEALAAESGSVTLLQPTSPLRNANHICEAFTLFRQFGDQGAVVSVCEAEHHPLKMLLLSETGQYYPVGSWPDLEQARQQLPKAYRPNGAVYINDIETLLQNRHFFAQPLHFYPMSAEDSVDIDVEADLQRAERILQQKG